MSILFINGSPNKNGNTAKLAAKLLTGKEYETLELVDYKLYAYGQKFEDDQFSEILEKMKEADTIVIGSPVYWHNMCGAVRNLLDRFYGPVSSGELSGRKFAFIFQGAAPELWMLEKAEYTMSCFAKMYGMEYAGMVTNEREAEKVSEKLGR
ncbi:flavodoxin family protein [Blautia sp. An46]|uniref:flavodoxin family protein n=1 Tax=Blautia sp. An46 TaxID=1965636 RepID=UPI000B3A10DB|nr:NAD(P)H-dependent oxidoreductase [Blautia sp. An46]OUN92683.1 NAD(P)H dehydrogenase [Blautia sp. An46]